MLTVEDFELPADATLTTLMGRLLDPQYAVAERNEDHAGPYDLLPLLIQTMTSINADLAWNPGPHKAGNLF